MYEDSDIDIDGVEGCLTLIVRIVIVILLIIVL